MEDRVTALPDASDPRGKAFAQYVLPEVEVLLRVAMTLTAQPADAEDLVQGDAAARVPGRRPVRREAPSRVAVDDYAAGRDQQAPPPPTAVA